MPRRNKIVKHLERVRPRKNLNQSEPEISISSNIISENAGIVGVSESSEDFTENVDDVYISESLADTNIISENAGIVDVLESSIDFTENVGDVYIPESLPDTNIISENANGCQQY